MVLVLAITKTELNGVVVIEPKVFNDNRGWFMETYSHADMQEVGFKDVFTQDNHSYSATKGTLRGLHFQNDPMAQVKLVRCSNGAIWDVAVDLRKSSPTYKRWIGVTISSENRKQLYIPSGFAHGYVTLENNTEVQYKVDKRYSKDHDRAIRYDDPDIGITWQVITPLISEKDTEAPFLKDSDCNFK